MAIKAAKRKDQYNNVELRNSEKELFLKGGFVDDHHPIAVQKILNPRSFLFFLFSHRKQR
jgi:hypothetical protein